MSTDPLRKATDPTFVGSGVSSWLERNRKIEENTMKHFGIAGLGIVGALAFTATSASAAIVCNEDGDCWHAKEKYDYKPEFGVHVYGDDWKWTDDNKYRWREHEGRGYWGPNGVWIEF
jgi:hypothetical protein